MIYDTIVALSTPKGTSALAIIRVSGNKTMNIIDKLLKKNDLESKKMYFGFLYNKDNKIIDEVTYVYHKSPNSYTGEDMLEIFCHGGIILVEKIIEEIYKFDIRDALNGEFSKRAVLNKKISLIKSETINEMIHSHTIKNYEFTKNQLFYGLNKSILDIKKNLLSLIAEIEVSLDYPDDFDIDYPHLEKSIQIIYNKTNRILENSDNGIIASKGIKTSIIGKPNVGKSTLLNSLLKKDRAIVTDIPGTTRDTIEEDLNIGGIYLRIIDTAGIRNTDDTIENLGIEKTNLVLNDSNLILFVLDSNSSYDENDISIYNKLKSLKNKRIFYIVNKTDLNTEYKLPEYIEKKDIVFISAKNNKIENLEEKIKNEYINIYNQEDPAVINNRQKNTLIKLNDNLKNALENINKKISVDFIMYDLRKSLEKLLELLGENYNEVLLEEIFSNFCVGK